MVFGVYSIKDKLQGFINVLLYVNDDVAKRDFAYSINNTPQMAYQASDIDLYKIGTFDNKKGDIVPEKTCVFICNGREVLSEK